MTRPTMYGISREEGSLFSSVYDTTWGGGWRVLLWLESLEIPWHPSVGCSKDGRGVCIQSVTGTTSRADGSAG